MLGGIKFTKSLNLTNVYPNNNTKNNINKVKSKPLELYELAGKNMLSIPIISGITLNNGKNWKHCLLIVCL
jgi:hypothetical protein